MKVDWMVDCSVDRRADSTVANSVCKMAENLVDYSVGLKVVSSAARLVENWAASSVGHSAPHSADCSVVTTVG